MTSRRAGRAGRIVSILLGAIVVAWLVHARTRADVDQTRPAPALRICADPNNLPFSNDREEGFENRLATLVARDLGRVPEYTWRAQRRGFIRHTLQADVCDLVMGVPAGLEPAWTTQPYYRSTYVFVSRATRHLSIGSLDDPRLRQLLVGVQMIGDDFANSPPAHALSARGMTRNIVGYSVLGDYAQPNPPARIIDAVRSAEVDVAIVWGPLAGFFARRDQGLALAALPPEAGSPALPFVFDIAMAVRPGNNTLRAAVDAIIGRRRVEIAALLDEFGVPRLPLRGATP